MRDEARGSSEGDTSTEGAERERAIGDNSLSSRRSGTIPGQHRDSAAGERREKREPLVKWVGGQRWISLTVPLVSCLALSLSSWEFVRESRNSVQERRAERIRDVQANMMTLVELETEYMRAMESSNQVMASSNLYAAMQILLEATSANVDDLMEHLNPSILVAFAYYNASAGNFDAAKRYYSTVLGRLDGQAMATNGAVRHAAIVGLGNLYFGDSTVANNGRARELFENAVAEYEQQPNMSNRSMLVELLGRWAYMEQSMGDPTLARELRRRAREVVPLLAPDDPRRTAYEGYLSDASLYLPGSLLQMNGEWHVEFLEDAARRGVATILRQAASFGSGWYIHAEIFTGERMVEQWGGNGFVSGTDVVIFPLQGYRRQTAFAPPIPVLGTVQLRPAAEDEQLLEGTYNVLGADGAGIRFRREN